MGAPEGGEGWGRSEVRDRAGPKTERGREAVAAEAAV